MMFSWTAGTMRAVTQEGIEVDQGTGTYRASGNIG